MELWQIFLGAFVMFVILGLPYLSRYMPYIRIKDDISDPTKDPLMKEGVDKNNNGNLKKMMIRALEIYVFFLLFLLIFNWLYDTFTA